MKLECSVEKIKSAIYQTERITGKNLTLPVLNAVFSNIPTGDNMYLEEKNGNLFIKTRKSSIVLKGQPHEDFPTIPLVSGSNFEIEPKKFIEGIKSVYYSSSVSD